MKAFNFGIVLILSLVAARAASAVSVAYDDPTGGWRYAFLGNAASPGTGTAGLNFTALDGTWDRENGSDSWDGSALGGTFAAGNAPGGISALSGSGVDYVRIQDPGNPTTAPTSIPDPSNRRVILGHSITADAGVVSPELIGEGVTLSFRARVATAAADPLIDPMFAAPAGGGLEGGGAPHGTAWPAAGSGWLGHDGGKGNFGIRQSGAGTGAGIISFNLGLASDTRSDAANTPFGITGLNMNSLNGTAPSGTVDPFQNEGTLNVLPIADLTVWHEFWITIDDDTSGGGTHRVDVYMDGSFIPNTFQVTAGTGNDYGGLSFLEMGLGGTPQLGAIDVDFYAYKEGVLSPGVLILGDVDGDGTGGEFPDDFNPIRDNFRKSPRNRPQGDLTGNGVVDFADFREWKMVHLGGGGSLADVNLSFLAGVPEPSAVALAILALAGLTGLRIKGDRKSDFRRTK